MVNKTVNHMIRINMTVFVIGFMPKPQKATREWILTFARCAFFVVGPQVGYRIKCGHITALTENEIALNERQTAKLLDIVKKLEQDAAYRAERRTFTELPCEENGFKAFDYEKLCGMVLFFAHKNSDLLKTKLMKLLNYSDMVFYKEHSISMSGSKYVHLPYGPVPENFEQLLGRMTADHIVHIEVTYDNGYEKHRVIPDCDIPHGILSEEELDVLERIYAKFKEFGSGDISKYSHEEKGYSSTKQGEIISYSYAKDIQLN